MLSVIVLLKCLSSTLQSKVFKNRNTESSRWSSYQTIYKKGKTYKKVKKKKKICFNTLQSMTIIQLFSE